MRSFRLTLSYDGTCFAGSQRQPNQRTVQGDLEQTLERLGAGPMRTVFAGRTDRGVHAVGQVAAVQLTRWRASSDALQRALNARLPYDMAVGRAVECEPAFNPRFDAAWREYRYWIACGGNDPFVRRYAWILRDGVDVGRADWAAVKLLGRHDFASFAGGGEGVPWSDRAIRKHGTTRSILRCACRRGGTLPIPMVGSEVTVVEFRVVADGFLPRMVRNIVGAVVEVGQGRRDPEWVSELLDARDRRLGSILAPAQGLTLWRVGFAGDEIEDW